MRQPVLDSRRAVRQTTQRQSYCRRQHVDGDDGLRGCCVMARRSILAMARARSADRLPSIVAPPARGCARASNDPHPGHAPTAAFGPSIRTSRLSDGTSAMLARPAAQRGRVDRRHDPGASQQPRRSRDREIALLETFADQAVIAIENARLFEELPARATARSREALEQQTATPRSCGSSPRRRPISQRVLDAIVESAARSAAPTTRVHRRAERDGDSMACCPSAADGSPSRSASAVPIERGDDGRSRRS